jgi:hypothetical protein
MDYLDLCPTGNVSGKVAADFLTDYTDSDEGNPLPPGAVLSVKSVKSKRGYFRLGKVPSVRVKTQRPNGVRAMPG